jgi:hypothetical protein
MKEHNMSDNIPATPTKSLIAQQLASEWSADSDKKLSDTQAMDLITHEMSGEEWDGDTFDVIAAYVRGTGRVIDDAVEVWTHDDE